MSDYKYNLFLDDERLPSDVFWVELPNIQWLVVRNSDDFCSNIMMFGPPEIVSFDYDLGSLSTGTGNDCAKFLAEYCVENNLPVPKYYIHSMNGIGRKNIISVLESAKKVLDKKPKIGDAGAEEDQP